MQANSLGNYQIVNLRKLRAVKNQVKGDLRDRTLLESIIHGCDAVIHLACISNDPSFELDPALGKSINYDAFTPLVEISKNSGVRRFIFASTSSVYGIKEEENVTEDLPLEPLTDYSNHISSEKIKREIGFVPKHTIEDAVRDLCDAFKAGKIPNPMTDLRYYNVKMMQAIKMT